mgnify:CR=1 FL=1
MKKTDNYSLPQWEKQDFIKMEDFNDAFGKTDAALKANADATATGLNAEIAARGEADAALSKNLGAAGHNCRIAWGSYTGTGTTGAASPNTLQFDFYPVLVLVAPVKPDGYTKNPMVLTRGRNVAATYPDGASKWELTVSWTDSSVSWYSSENDTGYQHNRSGSAYLYAMLGYDKAKETA